MIEAQGEIGFSCWQKLSLRRIPTWNDAAGTHAEHQRLLRQRNRRRPSQPKRAKVCHGSDRPTGSVGRQPALSRDRKSTRLNSSHGYISYAVFCLKKKTKC